MARSIWKGPFVHPSLLKKIDKLKDNPGKKPIKTWSRNSTIIPDFVGHSFMIHNGKSFIPITISEEMVGHKLGEFAPSRTFKGHTPADKKAAAENRQLHQLEKKMQKNNITVKAINKNVRSSPRKISLVLDHIRGKKVNIVLRDLDFIRKKISLDVSKTVKSAIANAENNNQLDIDNLYIKEAFVGKSLVMKRFRPRAKGRASPIKKPFSRITIVLSEKKEVASGSKN